MLENVAERLGARSPDELEPRLEALLQESRCPAPGRRAAPAPAGAGIRRRRSADGAREIGGVTVVAAAVQNSSAASWSALVDAVRQDLGSGVVVLGAVQDGRFQLVVGVTTDLTQRLKAGDLVKR